MVEALDVKSLAVRDRRSFKEFAHPEAMRALVGAENAYQMRDEELLALIVERFPDVRPPSIRTVQAWRQDAKRQWDEQRLAVVSKTLMRSANRVVPNSVAGLYEGFLNALDLMRVATEKGDTKTRVQALGRVNEIGNNLLNQFRGGPAEGVSAVDPASLEAQAVRSLVLSGRCKSEEEARALFLGLSEVVQQGAQQGEEGEGGAE